MMRSVPGRTHAATAAHTATAPAAAPAPADADASRLAADRLLASLAPAGTPHAGGADGDGGGGPNKEQVHCELARKVHSHRPTPSQPADPAATVGEMLTQSCSAFGRALSRLPYTSGVAG